LSPSSLSPFCLPYLTPPFCPSLPPPVSFHLDLFTSRYLSSSNNSLPLYPLHSLN
jgi:hypothetical protein